MDQTDYIRTFKPIAHLQLVGASPDVETTAVVHVGYMSLLGAVAVAMFTHMLCISVYVVALQRRTKRSANADARRLNAVVRVLHRAPQELVYLAIARARTVAARTDAALIREEET